MKRRDAETDARAASTLRSPNESSGEIDKTAEHLGIVVEKEVHALERRQYCVL